MKRKNIAVWIILLLLVVVILVISGCDTKGKKQKKEIEDTKYRIELAQKQLEQCKSEKRFYYPKSDEDDDSEKPPKTPLSNYPLTYVGGNTKETCAFQRGEDCKSERYCPNDQWIKAKDTITCCQNACVARVQHRDVNFGSPLGLVTIERLSGNRFIVWYGSGVRGGFVDVGRPNYVEAKGVGENKYEFIVEGKVYLFSITKNEANKIVAVPGNAPAPAPGEVVPPTPPTTTPVTPSIIEVSIKNSVYDPSIIAIKKGTTVKWTNNDNIAHTVASGIFDSKALQPGQSFSFTFNDVGIINYNCALHPVSMKGGIAVT